MNQTLVKVENLKKHFPIKGGVLGKTIGEVKAVDGLSFSIYKGKPWGLSVKAVAESLRREGYCFDCLSRARAMFISKERT